MKIPVLDAILPGDRVTILVPNGIGRDGQEYKESTGLAVMRGPAGWVLNMGGRFGTPGVATEENFVRATRPSFKKAADVYADAAKDSLNREMERKAGDSNFNRNSH